MFKLPAQVAYRGTRGAYRKMKRRKRVGRGMIFSEDGDHQVVEGPLHNWVNYLRGWRRRWFILESPGLLAYYSNHKKKTCLGTIPLTDATVTISRRSPLRFVVDTDYGVFYLRATSAEQRDQWIDGIKDSQVLYDLQQGREPPVSAGEADGSHNPEPGLDGDGYDEYDMDDRIYGGYTSAEPTFDATELDEVRVNLRRHVRGVCHPLLVRALPRLWLHLSFAIAIAGTNGLACECCGVVRVNCSVLL